MAHSAADNNANPRSEQNGQARAAGFWPARAAVPAATDAGANRASSAAQPEPGAVMHPPAGQAPGYTRNGHGEAASGAGSSGFPGMDDPAARADVVAADGREDESDAAASAALAIAPHYRSSPAPLRSPLNLTLLAGCVGALTMLIAGGLLLTGARQRLQQQGRQAQQRTTIALVTATTQMLEARYQEAAILANGSSLTDLDFWQQSTAAEKQAVLADLQARLPGYDQLALLDRQGRIILQTGTDTPIPAKIGEAAYVQQAIATAQPTLGLTTTVPALAIAVPLQQNGRLMMVMHLRLAPTAFPTGSLLTPAQAAASPSPTDLEAYILTEAGVILSSPESSAIGAAIATVDPPVARLLLTESAAQQPPVQTVTTEQGLMSVATATVTAATPPLTLAAVVRQPLPELAWSRSPLSWGLAVATVLAGGITSGLMAWSLRRQHLPLQTATRYLADYRVGQGRDRLPAPSEAPWGSFYHYLNRVLNQVETEIGAQAQALRQAETDCATATTLAQSIHTQLEQAIADHRDHTGQLQGQIAAQQVDLARLHRQIATYQQQTQQHQRQLDRLHQAVVSADPHPTAAIALPDQWGEIARAFADQQRRFHHLIATVKATVPQVQETLATQLHPASTEVDPAVDGVDLPPAWSDLHTSVQTSVAQTQRLKTAVDDITPALSRSQQVAAQTVDHSQLLPQAIAAEQQTLAQIQQQVELVAGTMAQLNHILETATLATVNAALKTARQGDRPRTITPWLKDLRSLHQQSVTLTTRLITLLTTVTPDIQTLAIRLHALEPSLRQLEALPHVQADLATMARSQQHLQAHLAQLSTTQATQLQAMETLLPLLRDRQQQLTRSQAQAAQLTHTLTQVWQAIQALDLDLTTTEAGSR